MPERSTANLVPARNSEAIVARKLGSFIKERAPCEVANSSKPIDLPNAIRWVALSAATLLQILAKIPQLSLGIPIGRPRNTFAGPKHSALDPISPPLLEADSSIVVVVTELETARWTNFV